MAYSGAGTWSQAGPPAQAVQGNVMGQQAQCMGQQGQTMGQQAQAMGQQAQSMGQQAQAMDCGQAMGSANWPEANKMPHCAMPARPVPMDQGIGQPAQASVQASVQANAQASAQASGSASGSAQGTAPWHGTGQAMADNGPSGAPMPGKLAMPMPGTNWAGHMQGSAEAMAMGPGHPGYAPQPKGVASFLGLGHWTDAEPHAEQLHKALGDAQQHLVAVARGVQIALEHKDCTYVAKVWVWVNCVPCHCSVTDSNVHALHCHHHRIAVSLIPMCMLCLARNTWPDCAVQCPGLEWPVSCNSH